MQYSTLLLAIRTDQHLNNNFIKEKIGFVRTKEHVAIKTLQKDFSTAAGLEPTREFPKRFLVFRLNRSAKQPI